MKVADWITVFAASQTPSMFLGGKSHTTRVIIPINVGGNVLRLRFANNGAKKGSIAHVTVAKCDKEGNLLDSTCRQVLFQGKRGTELEVGSETVSDKIEMNISVKEFLAVSIYCDKAPQSAAGIFGYVANAPKKGDFTEVSYKGKKMPSWLPKLMSQFLVDQIPYLTAVETETDEKPAVLCCFGDSVTAQSQWFKPLQKKLYRKYPGKIVMLNQGICGNRLLAETPGKIGASFGKAGIERMYQDIYGRQGITHVLMALGINDLNLSESKNDKESHIPTPEEFREAYQKMKSESGARGIKVLAFSIYPGAVDEKREKIRQAYNKVMEVELGDCYIKIDDILSVPGESRYKEGYGFRDGVHLTRRGGKALADGLDLKRLAGLLGL